MRRFSQRNSLVTLNEINITPLLDLAFVLLIIFIITQPMLEQSIDLKLPEGGSATPQTANPKDALTVEVTKQGVYRLNGRVMRLDQIFPVIQQAFAKNPNSFVSVRADGEGDYNYVAAVLDGCQKRGITRFSLKTFPDK